MKNFFDVKPTQKGVSLSVSSNKDTNIKGHIFSSPFSCKMRSKNLRPYNSKTPANSNKFF